jgi:hypothetical protein
MDLFIVNNYVEANKFMITMTKYDFETLIFLLIKKIK